MTARMTPVLRDACPADVPVLAQIWYDGWQDGHAGLVPEKLARNRTLESFAGRLMDGLPQVRVVELETGVAGFHMILDDELNQFFLAAAARGRGVADRMMADVEERLRTAGWGTAWLACAIGNDRAARFYEKQGWNRVGVMTSRLKTPEGEVPLDVWRYERVIPAGPV